MKPTLLLAGAILLAGCATRALPPADPAPPTIALVTVPARAGDIVPPQFQYLYGSAEAAALSEQAYNGLTRWVVPLSIMLNRPGTGDRDPVSGRLKRAWSQAVLAPGATAARPVPLPCSDGQPFAVVVDVDETALLNLGYEYREAHGGGGFDPQRWEAWERSGGAAVVAVPGAQSAFRALRVAGVTVIANSNRSAANAAATERALANAGLGAFRHGETLFLKGDVDGKSGKDGRRAAIAARWCVLAMAGDQLGDFADFFNAPGPAPAPGRRALASAPGIAARWGNGWFLLPNPVYGTGLGSGWDETFPTDKRWADPAPKE